MIFAVVFFLPKFQVRQSLWWLVGADRHFLLFQMKFNLEGYIGGIRYARWWDTEWRSRHRWRALSGSQPNFTFLFGTFCFLRVQFRFKPLYDLLNLELDLRFSSAKILNFELNFEFGPRDSASNFGSEPNFTNTNQAGNARFSSPYIEVFRIPHIRAGHKSIQQCVVKFLHEFSNYAWLYQ